MLRILTSIFVASLLFIAAVPAQADGKHFLWRVSKGGDSLYLAGSVHVLRPADYPLPTVMEQAFSASAGLVEEIDLASADPESTQLDVLKLGTYPTGKTLKDSLPPDMYAKVAKQAGDLGIDMSILENLRPWLVSITLLEAQLAKAGYSPGDGADLHFANEAQSLHKPVTGLEDMHYQLGLLAGLSDQSQQALLLQAVDESAGFDTEMQEMISAWHTGDTGILEKALTQDFGGYHDVYQAVLVARNEAWAPKLEALLASGKQYFVIVGALHLVGPDGLLQRFKKDGYTVEQL